MALSATDTHHKVKHKKTKVKKTKYQDFDASLVKDEGILSSIMKVLGLNQCPAVPPDLVGPIEIDTQPEFLENVEKRLAYEITLGGRFKPSDCRARDRVAIVIPFRDRKQHLPVLLKNLHPFLMRQQIDYGIFLVEQSTDGSFNRAKLMNVGYTEALKLYEWDCFVFHDVDLLPLDDRNLYTCPSQPRHMSVAVDTFGFKWDQVDQVLSIIFNKNLIFADCRTHPSLAVFLQWPQSSSRLSTVSRIHSGDGE